MDRKFSGRREKCWFPAFSFYLHCFQKLFLLGRQKSSLYGKNSINPFPNEPCFFRICSITRLKTLWEKEKLLATSNCPFSHSVFYPLRELSAISEKFKIVVCKLFRIGRIQNLSFGKGLQPYHRKISHLG